MGQSFFPQNFEQINNVPTVTLGIALYFVRATLFDPSSNADVALPSHSWVLLHQSSARGAGLRAVARGTASDANGRCVIMRPSPIEPGRYALGFTPLPPAIRKGYLERGEVLLALFIRVDQGAGVTAVARASVNKLLAEAAERWSQGHPGITSISQNKRYALVPQDASKRANVIGRIRAFFGEVSSGEFIDLQLVHEPTGNARSSNRSGWLIFDGTLTYYDSAIASDTSGLLPDKDLDGVTLTWHTLAHEFGHALGLPDEYVERMDTASIGPGLINGVPVLPDFDQPAEGWTDYRPFYGDDSAIMSSNRLPRLRHLWHHVKALNEDGAFASAGAPLRLDP